MEKKDKDIMQADKIIHDAIMNEGEYLKEKLGPVTYKNPEGCDIDADFQRLIKARAELEAENLEYEVRTEANAAKMEAAAVEMPATKIKEFESATAKKNKTIRKSFGSFAKAAVIVLVAGVCIAGFSFQSEATRMWWMESLGWHLGDDSTTQIDNDSIRDLSEAPEWEAASTIEKELGIKVPKLQYQPSKFEFSDYMYETITNMAIMYYKIGSEYLTINMIIGINDYTSSANFDGSVLSQEIMEMSYGSVFIKEIQNGDNDKKTVVAEWDYQDTHYEIFGRISFEEMKAIVKNIVL